MDDDENDYDYIYLDEGINVMEKNEEMLDLFEKELIKKNFYQN